MFSLGRVVSHLHRHRLVTAMAVVVAQAASLNSLPPGDRFLKPGETGACPASFRPGPNEWPLPCIPTLEELPYYVAWDAAYRKVAPPVCPYNLRPAPTQAKIGCVPAPQFASKLLSEDPAYSKAIKNYPMPAFTPFVEAQCRKATFAVLFAKEGKAALADLSPSFLKTAKKEWEMCKKEHVPVPSTLPAPVTTTTISPAIQARMKEQDELFASN